jgi:hypothetical protein
MAHRFYVIASEVSLEPGVKIAQSHTGGTQYGQSNEENWRKPSHG